MKVVEIKPVVETKVTITMTGYEARRLMRFMGASSVGEEERKLGELDIKKEQSIVVTVFRELNRALES